MRTALKTAASEAPPEKFQKTPQQQKAAKSANAPSAKENAPIHALEADTFPVTLPKTIIIARIPYKGTTLSKA